MTKEEATKAKKDSKKDKEKTKKVKEEAVEEEEKPVKKSKRTKVEEEPAAEEECVGTHISKRFLYCYASLSLIYDYDAPCDISPFSELDTFFRFF